MSIRIPYGLSIAAIAAEYVDIAVSTEADGRYGFIFMYRKESESEWRSDAVVSCSSAKRVKRNSVEGVEGDCTVRWHFAENGLYAFDRMVVQVRPEAGFEVRSASGSGCLVSHFVDGIGIYDISSDAAPAAIADGSVTWNGDIIYSGAGDESRLMTFDWDGETRILLADTAGKVVELKTSGAVVNELSGNVPVFCDYNDEDGSICVAYSDIPDVRAIAWKNAGASLETSASFGSVNFSYASAIGGSLSDLKAATFGMTQDMLSIVDGSSIKVVNMSSASETVRSSISFETSQSGVSSATMSLGDLRFAMEYGNGRIAAIAAGGSELVHGDSRLSHEAYQRSLGPSAATPIHRGLFGATANPVSPRGALTLKILNSAALRRAAMSELRRGRGASYLGYIGEDQHRAAICGDIPEWGFEGVSPQTGGTQVLSAMTGQQIRVDVPYTQRIGYAVDGDQTTPAFVTERVSVVLRNLSTGTEETVLSPIVLTGDVDFSFSVPDADEDSYASSQISGNHGEYVLEISVEERYYATASLSSQTLPGREYKYYVGLVAYWWRQTLKETQVSESPVSDCGFELENYSQTAAEFFDEWTVFPQFYRTVGGAAVEPTDDQKAVMVFDSAHALLSYSAGTCPGSSPVVPVLATNPASYEPSSDDRVENLARADTSAEETRSAPFYGLLADPQSSNVFEDFPASAPGLQDVRDSARMLFLDGDSFRHDEGPNGMLVLSGATAPSQVQPILLDGSRNLSIELDETDLVVGNIGFYASPSATSPVGQGSYNVVVAFSMFSGSPSGVCIGFSVDGSPVVSYEDPTGAARQFNFGISSPLTASSVLKAVIVLEDADGEEHLYRARESLAERSEESAITGVTLLDDRVGRTLHVVYDVDARYDFVPVTVDVSITFAGSNFIGVFVGDVGEVFQGAGRKASLSYAELEDESMDSLATVTLSATDPVTGVVVGDTTVYFYLRPPEQPVSPFASVPEFLTRKYEASSGASSSAALLQVASSSAAANVKDDQALPVVADMRFAVSSSSCSSSSKSLSSSSCSSSQSYSPSSCSCSLSLSSSCSSSSCSSSSSSSSSGSESVSFSSSLSSSQSTSFSSSSSSSLSESASPSSSSSSSTSFSPSSSSSSSSSVSSSLSSSSSSSLSSSSSSSQSASSSSSSSSSSESSSSSSSVSSSLSSSSSTSLSSSSSSSRSTSFSSSSSCSSSASASLSSSSSSESFSSSSSSSSSSSGALGQMILLSGWQVNGFMNL